MIIKKKIGIESDLIQCNSVLVYLIVNPIGLILEHYFQFKYLYLILPRNDTAIPDNIKCFAVCVLGNGLNNIMLQKLSQGQAKIFSMQYNLLFLRHLLNFTFKSILKLSNVLCLKDMPHHTFSKILFELWNINTLSGDNQKY